MSKRPARHRAPQGARRYLLGTALAATALATALLGNDAGSAAPRGTAVSAAANTRSARPVVISATATSSPAAGSATGTTSPSAANPTAGPSAAPGTTAAAPPQRRKTRKPEQPPAAPANNPNCTLTVPANPLTAQGLAAPYVLSGTEPGGDCHEANNDQSAFVEATIVDPATGALSIYRPLVVDRGDKPAVAPVAPALPAGAVVGIWFGFNGDTLRLRGEGDSLNTGACVNGTDGSPFGQFGYCNARSFFTAANNAIVKGQLSVPALGIGNDGLACPTVRDFGVVDQDQSDNVTTAYVATASGRTAQAGHLAGGTPLTNGSDNGLLDNFIDPALGCKPFTAPDLTRGGAPGTSLALDELQAAAHQSVPVALVPLSDPMTQIDGQQSVAKANLYRAGVDQPMVNTGTDTPEAYCANLAKTGATRLAADRQFFAQAPAPGAGANLADFLTQRLQSSLQTLGCQG
ncbi:hypothetical protein [Amycolatopsis benzoatilytica]|uniref:hypothetical protein n=1 Tax=Amycolatopsis benzoatilytica TaxID=346045 RepID=UPI0012B69647|nr:hypothetical protein [Amycolatopsis benzoatilytica]